jgi:hypothetical protein
MRAPIGLLSRFFIDMKKNLIDSTKPSLLLLSLEYTNDNLFTGGPCLQLSVKLEHFNLLLVSNSYF